MGHVLFHFELCHDEAAGRRIAQQAERRHRLTVTRSMLLAKLQLLPRHTAQMLSARALKFIL